MGEKQTIYQYDDKLDRALWDRSKLERKGKEVIVVENILETLQQAEGAIDFLVNIRGYKDLIKIRENNQELHEKIGKIHIHSCLSGNLYLHAKENEYLQTYLEIENRIRSKETATSLTPEAEIFLDNI